MESPLSLGRVLVAMAFYGYLMWSGYRRRVPYWTRKSWHRFAVLMTSAVGGVIAALAMAVSVDLGIYDVIGGTLASMWFYIMTFVGGVGLVGAITLLIWFGWGQPNRQLGWPTHSAET